LCLREENFGFLASLTRFAVVAKNQLLVLSSKPSFTVITAQVAAMITP
jgi:hypothetical protein